MLMKNEVVCTHNLTHDSGGGGGGGDGDGGADAHHSSSSSSSSCHVTTDLQPLPVPTEAALKLTSSLPSNLARAGLDKSVPVHDHDQYQYQDQDRGLSRSFRMSVILASVLMMAVVVLCLTVVLPRTARKHESELNRKSQFYVFGIDPRRGDHFSDVPSYLNFAVGTVPNLQRRHRKHEIPPQELPPVVAALISKACGATLLPQVCRMSLESDPATRSATSLLSIIDIALGISRSQILSCISLSDALLHSSAAAFNANLTDAARECSYLLNRAESFHGQSKATSLLIQKPWQVADSQAWMSAALTYANDCRSALSYVNVTTSVDYLMGQVSYAINLTSNALAMIGAVRADNGDWAPPNRLSLYSAVAPPPPSSGSANRWCYQRASATVAKDGSADYSTVQAAVDAAPDGGSEWYTIHIKEGVYEEIVRVPPSKKRLAMVGDGMGRTVITGSLNAQMPGVTTYDTATVGVGGDEFMAVGMTFENTAGAAKHQAVALMVDSDFSAFYNCSFLGHQDTLYAHSLRHFYHGCWIEGTVDFIFGNAAAVFEACEIIFRPGLLPPGPGSGSTTSMATAQGRTDPGETTGLVFHHCTLDGTPEFRQQWAAGRNHAYLGRPWKLFSRTVFLECSLPDFVEPQGWLPWRGDFALSTLFYGEFLNTGPGARPASIRVPWSQQLTYETASLFSVDPFIQGDRWLPSSP